MTWWCTVDRRQALLALAGLASLPLAACQPPPFPVGTAPTPQAVPTAPDQERLTRTQLEQALAPVALYPDALLAQVLMAATYPIEVVEAHQWLGRDNRSSLQGEALARALEAKPWDPSVKSLVFVPSVLATMADHVDWTMQIGDAVLAQQQEVLDAVQALRRRALASGNLKDSGQQTVSETVGADGATVIVIGQPEPEIIYVPVHDPWVVYGGWPYPDYPPIYYPPPAALVAIGEVIGIANLRSRPVATPYWGYARPGWGRGGIDIDADRVQRIPRAQPLPAGGRWQHDPAHRLGAAYRDEAVRTRFQGDRSRQAASREQYRGRTAEPGRGPGGLEGIGHGRDVRSASDRGLSSRQPAGYGRGGFGGFGGGRGGGFGGGGRGGRR